jgi:hypothetical protein
VRQQEMKRESDRGGEEEATCKMPRQADWAAGTAGSLVAQVSMHKKGDGGAIDQSGRASERAWGRCIGGCERVQVASRQNSPPSQWHRGGIAVPSHRSCGDRMHSSKSALAR